MSKSRIGEPYHGKVQGDRVYNQMKQKMVENEKTVQALTSELKTLTGADLAPQDIPFKIGSNTYQVPTIPAAPRHWQPGRD